MDVDLVAFLEKLGRSVTLLPVSLQAPSPSELLPPAKSCAVLCRAAFAPVPTVSKALEVEDSSGAPLLPPPAPAPALLTPQLVFLSQLSPPRHRTGSPSPCTAPRVGAAPSEPRSGLQPGCPPGSPSWPEPGPLVSSPVSHSRPRSPGHLGMCWLCMSQGVCGAVRLLLANICPNVVAEDGEVSAAAAQAQPMSTHGDARPRRDGAFC